MHFSINNTTIIDVRLMVNFILKTKDANPYFITTPLLVLTEQKQQRRTCKELFTFIE